MSENNYISIKGARVNNLKNIDVDIPRNKTNLLLSPDCRVRENHHLLLIPFMQRDNAAT